MQELLFKKPYKWCFPYTSQSAEALNMVEFLRSFSKLVLEWGKSVLSFSLHMVGKNCSNLIIEKVV